MNCFNATVQTGIGFLWPHLLVSCPKGSRMERPETAGGPRLLADLHPTAKVIWTTKRNLCAISQGRVRRSPGPVECSQSWPPAAPESPAVAPRSRAVRGRRTATHCGDPAAGRPKAPHLPATGRPSSPAHCGIDAMRVQSRLGKCPAGPKLAHEQHRTTIWQRSPEGRDLLELPHELLPHRCLVLGPVLGDGPLERSCRGGLQPVLLRLPPLPLLCRCVRGLGLWLTTPGP